MSFRFYLKESLVGLHPLNNTVFVNNTSNLLRDNHEMSLSTYLKQSLIEFYLLHNTTCGSDTNNFLKENHEMSFRPSALPTIPPSSLTAVTFLGTNKYELSFLRIYSSYWSLFALLTTSSLLSLTILRIITKCGFRMFKTVTRPVFVLATMQTFVSTTSNLLRDNHEKIWLPAYVKQLLAGTRPSRIPPSAEILSTFLGKTTKCPFALN